MNTLTTTPIRPRLNTAVVGMQDNQSFGKKPNTNSFNYICLTMPDIRSVISFAIKSKSSEYDEINRYKLNELFNIVN